MRSNYQRAVSYAWKCCPPLSKDLVHEAYVRYYTKHKDNLFDQNIYVVLRWVKNVWFNEIRNGTYSGKGKYMVDGKLYTYETYEIGDWTRSPEITPDKQLMSKEFYEELFKRVDSYIVNENPTRTLDPKHLRQYLELFDQGYSNVEIAKIMGMSPQRVNYYKNKIRKIIMEINNPFNGNLARPVKKISRKVYEEKYKDTYVYDPDKGDWCDFNETAMLAVHKDKEEYILVKEKAD